MEQPASAPVVSAGALWPHFLRISRFLAYFLLLAIGAEREACQLWLLVTLPLPRLAVMQ